MLSLACFLRPILSSVFAWNRVLSGCCWDYLPFCSRRAASRGECISTFHAVVYIYTDALYYFLLLLILGIFLLAFYFTGLPGRWLEDYILLSWVCCVTKEQQNPKFYARESNAWNLDPLLSLPHTKKSHYKPKTHSASICCRSLSASVGYWTIGLGEMMIYSNRRLKDVMWCDLPARRTEETDRGESGTRSGVSDRLASVFTRDFQRLGLCNGRSCITR